MPYVSTNYDKNPKAPVGTWVCAPLSGNAPYTSSPDGDDQKNPDYCGQCVSYVRTVCPGMPATSAWERGELVKGNTKVRPGTAIATFMYDKVHNRYFYRGHAAIYVGQDKSGIQVYDQWVSGAPSPIHARTIHWQGKGTSNTGDLFYVVE